jgi:acetyl esterase/lipase
LIEHWPKQSLGEEGLAEIIRSRQDRLPAGALTRNGAFQVTEHLIPSRSQDNQRLTVMRPNNSAPRGAIFWLHSGGQIGGSAVAADITPVLDIAQELAMVVVAAEYALAPEFPAPAGLDDAYDGFLWTIRHAAELGYPRDALFLHGLSAGGGLAAGTALLAREAGIKYGGLVLDGPMLDDRLQTVSMKQHELSGLPMIHSLRLMWAAVINSASPHHSYSVPGRLVGQNLSGLPPAYIVCGANDPFRDETTEFAEAIWRSGGSADLHQWTGIGHGFDLLAADAHVCRELIEGRRGWYSRVLHHIENGRLVR